MANDPPGQEELTVDEAPEPKQSLLGHLLELRSCLLRAVIGYVLVLIPLAILARPIYHLLAEPLLRLLPPGHTMIATQVASPFITPLKLSLVLSLVVALPWLFYQIWGFVAPGLYRNERRMIIPLLVSSTLLFYAGVAFAYFFVLSHVFSFFIAVAPEGVAVMTDINEYLSFVLNFFVAFGIAFEMPVAIVLVCWTGLTTVEKLKKSRAYVFVGVFVVGAVIAPPDVLSQFLLAGSMYLLYEFGLIWAGWVVRQKKQGRDDDEGDTDDDDEARTSDDDGDAGG